MNILESLEEEMMKALAHKDKCSEEKNRAIHLLGKAYAEFRRTDEGLQKSYVEVYRIRDLIDNKGEAI